MAQFALPTSDNSKGASALDCSGGDGNAYDDLDEGFGAGRGSGSGPDDGTTRYKHNSGTEANAFIICNLYSVTDPASSAGHIYRVRVRRVESSGTCTDSITGQQTDERIQLRQGTTVINETTQTNVTAWATIAVTLSGAEADAITNYGDLNIYTGGVVVGGGSARRSTVSALELEVPNAGAAAYTLDAAAGSYAISGLGTQNLATRLLAAATGSYAVTGRDILFGYGRFLAAAAGSYTITGQGTDLLAARILNGDPGIYALNGLNALLVSTRLLEAATGNYAITGLDAILAKGYAMDVGTGSYVISGTDSLLLATRILDAAAGSYVITGGDALGLGLTSLLAPTRFQLPNAFLKPSQEAMPLSALMQSCSTRR
jgi:hypothetical protein